MMTKKNGLVLIFALFSIAGCAQHPVFWNTNGAYKGRTIWNVNDAKINAPKHVWVNKNGEEVMWKDAKKKESNSN